MKNHPIERAPINTCSPAFAEQHRNPISSEAPWQPGSMWFVRDVGELKPWGFGSSRGFGSSCGFGPSGGFSSTACKALSKSKPTKCRDGLMDQYFWLRGKEILSKNYEKIRLWQSESLCRLRTSQVWTVLQGTFLLHPTSFRYPAGGQNLNEHTEAIDVCHLIFAEIVPGAHFSRW